MKNEVETTTQGAIPTSAFTGDLLPLTVDYNDPEFKEKFAESIHKTGFGVIKIPNGQLGIYRTELLAAQEENKAFLDDMSLETVMQALFMNDRWKDAGVFPFGAEGRTDGPPNLVEYLHHRWDTRDSEENQQRAGANITFPGHPFTQTWNVYAGMMRLNVHLTDALVEGMPAGEEFEAVRANMKRLRNQLDNKKRNVVRFLKYYDTHPRFPDAKPDLDPEDGVPVWNDSHEDADWLTLIPMQSKPGLQLRDNKGSWYDVPWESNQDADYIYIVVNAGDTLSAASGGKFALCKTIREESKPPNKLGEPLDFEGWADADENLHMWRDGDHYGDLKLRLLQQGYYPSTTHRVKAGTGIRYSMPFFFHINGWVKVQGHWTARDKLRGYVLNKEKQRNAAIKRISALYR